MVDGDRGSRAEALRGKQRVILLCAPVTLLFTLADTVALGRFSLRVFAVRLLWALGIAATALLLPRVSERAERRLMMGLAIASSACFALLAWMTGGYRSPLFHWILAMPLVIAVVLQEHPAATLGAALTTVASGVAIVAASGQSAALAVEWAIQASGMSALAVYASVSYRRLRQRAQAAREASLLAEERARAADAAVRARDEFLGVASHELKTPLTALRLHVERLVRGVSLSAGATVEQATMVAHVDKQVDRLSALVETLLDVSRITAGRLKLDAVEGDLAAAVRQAVERYTQLAQRQGCALELRANGRLPAVFDSARIDQVVSNLLGNAIKFGAGRPVAVEVQGDAAAGRIIVRDQGIGISPEDQARIFGRFERAVSDRNYGGMGLGLWISAQIVQQMGGKIDVASKPGEGATFTVEVPLARG